MGFGHPHLGPMLGGIQKDMLCLASEFIRQGDQMAFVTTYDEFPEGRVDLDRPLTYELPPGLPVVRLEGRLRTHLRHFQPANPPLWLPSLAHTVQRLTPDVDHLRGCNMSFHRSALEAIGGFDARYIWTNVLEETDVCIRVKRAGRRLVFKFFLREPGFVRARAVALYALGAWWGLGDSLWASLAGRKDRLHREMEQRSKV